MKRFLISAIIAASASAMAISFPNTLPLSEAAVRLPMFRDAKTAPLPQSRTFVYTFTQGAEQWQEEMFDPHELWFSRQYVGQWYDHTGASITLAKVVSILPQFQSRHVSRANFDAAMDSAAASIEQLDDNALMRWMRDFTGMGISGSQALNINRLHLIGLTRYETGDPNVLAYAFRFDPNRSGNPEATRSWFAVKIATTGAKPSEDERIVEREFLGKLAPANRFEASTKRDASASLRQPQVREHPSRASAMSSIESLPGWWHLNSEDYIILSNNPGVKKFAADILQDLQDARAVFEKVVPMTNDSLDDVCVVRIFNSNDEYVNYVGEGQKWSVGLFDPMRRELVISPPKGADRNAMRASIRSTILHEGFHQYDFFAKAGRQSPPWYNEGLAMFFEEAQVGVRGAVRIDENKMRTQLLAQILEQNGPVNVRDYLVMDYAQFYAGTQQGRLANYSMCYALAYYMLRGAPQVRNKPFDGILERTGANVAAGHSMLDATLKAFEGIDMRKFNDDFIDFWTSSRRRQQALRDSKR